MAERPDDGMKHDANDERVAAAFRALPPVEPPAALDDAIRAAARRAVSAGPATEAPRRARRWAMPVSVAAVMALAIGVALHVDRETPVIADGSPVPGEAAKPATPKEPANIAPPAAVPVQPPAAPSAVIAPSAIAPPPAPAAIAPPPTPAAIAPPPAPAAIAPPPSAPPVFAPAPPAPARESAPRAASAPSGLGANADSARAAPMQAKRAKAERSEEAVAKDSVAEPPERRLERIAKLREEGRHDEADRELARFRRDLPDYRMSDDWRRRVERR